MPDSPMPETFTRRLMPEPKSIDLQARTVNLVWSTGAGVRRQDYRGDFTEYLDLAGADLSRLNAGAPFVDSHRVYGLAGLIGVVIQASVRNGEGVATVRFSRRDDVEPIWRDVQDGIARNISVGYTVSEWRESVDQTTGARIKTAVRLQPYELSLVAVGADAGAIIRAKEEIMPELNTPGTAQPPAAVTTTTAPAVETRAAINTEIRTIAQTAGLGAEFADRQIDAGATVEQTRAAAFSALQDRTRVQIGTARIQVGQSNDDPNTRCRQMGEALFSRVNRSHQLSEPARQYAHMSMVDLARESLRMHGTPVTGLSPAELITRSLHTTSDFSIILGDAVGRLLRPAYQAAAPEIKKLARETTAQDFRARYKIMLGEAPTLLKVPEHGEIKRGSMAEAKESYKLETFARIFGISRQALVNDDLGAFDDLSARFGVAAAGFEAQQLVDLLVSNSGLGPVMTDGQTLFHSTHKNVAGSGAAIGEATLNAARLAMRKQTGLSGGLIEVKPKFLLLPPDLETAGEKQLAALAAAAVEDVNPFSGRLSLIIENRLADAFRWYVTADPAQFEGLEYAYLEGAPGPQITTRNGFDIDGVETKVLLDFGCGFVDSRGWFSNAGH